MATMLESPVSLIVGTVGADGLPDAGRAWGAEVIDGDRVRVLLSANAAITRRNVERGGAIAVTATHFSTNESVQLKGHAESIEEPTPADRIRFDRYCAGAARAIAELDGTPGGARDALHDRRGRRVRGEGGVALRPDPRPFGRRAARPGVAMTTDERRIALSEIAACFEGVIPAEIATASADGVPNVTHLSRVHMVDDERVALSNQFFSKTMRNLAENPNACVVVVDPTNYDSYRMMLQYERTERRGPIFERLRRDVDAIAALTGMEGIFKLRSADVYRVVDIELVQAAVHESGS